eukprot:gene7755-3270_t
MAELRKGWAHHPVATRRAAGGVARATRSPLKDGRAP